MHVKDVQLQNRLTELRKLAGLSQQDLADRLNVTRQAVSRWESGKGSPTIDMLLRLRELYGVSMDDLLGRTQAPPKSEEPAPTQAKQGACGAQPRLARIALIVCAVGVIVLLLLYIFRPSKTEPDATPLENVPGEVIDLSPEDMFSFD